MKNKIIKYINIIDKEDIVLYCKKNNISITSNEVDILYYYIKNKYDSLFDNPLIVFNELKPLISNHLYEKILELYDKYKLFI